MPFARFNFDSSQLTKLHRPVAEKLNVVILYERLAHVSRAVATYQQLARELAGSFAPDFRLWRLDLALEPAFAAEAERDLADAAVIIMAVRVSQPCPPEFQRWKNGAGHVGGPSPHAIIALVEAATEPEPPPESWSELLCSAATQIHSEVFVCDPAGRR